MNGNPYKLILSIYLSYVYILSIAIAKEVRTQNARYPQWHLVNNQTGLTFCGFDFLTKISILQCDLGLENKDVLSLHSKAFPGLTTNKLENLGFYNYRPQGEYHRNNPEMAKALHRAVDNQDYDHYEVYRQQLKNRPVTALPLKLT